MIKHMLTYAQSLLGAPYIWGGNGPFFDCSGFVQEVLASVGVDPAGDQTAQALYDTCKAREWPSQFAHGSLLFYGKSRDKITHVAILLNDSLMIEAGGGDSSTLTLEDAIKKGAMVRQRPIRKNFIAVLKPQFQ